MKQPIGSPVSYEPIGRLDFKQPIGNRVSYAPIGSLDMTYPVGGLISFQPIGSLDLHRPIKNYDFNHQFEIANRKPCFIQANRKAQF